MKKILISVIIAVSNYSFGQIKALTEDGKEVVLFENKTWRFTNETDEKQKSDIRTSENVFSKAADATFLLRSAKIDAGIYFNPKKWKTLNAKMPPMEYTFQCINSQNTMMMAAVTSEIIPVQTLRNLRDLLLANIQKNSDYFKLINSEYRTVNDNKVLFVEYALNKSGVDFHYIGNYYLNENGYCNAVAFTYEKDFDKNKFELLNFINGLSKVEKSKTVETIEYSSPPPPPMNNKNK